MKKSTKILATCLSAAAIATADAIYLNSQDTPKKYAFIFENGELIKSIELSSVTSPYSIELSGNIIFVEKGQLSIIEADSSDKICIKQDAISPKARPIICLSDNIIIKLTDDENDTDITPEI